MFPQALISLSALHHLVCDCNENRFTLLFCVSEVNLQTEPTEPGPLGETGTWKHTDNITFIIFTNLHLRVDSLNCRESTRMDEYFLFFPFVVVYSLCVQAPSFVRLWTLIQTSFHHLNCLSEQWAVCLALLSILENEIQNNVILILNSSVTFLEWISVVRRINYTSKFHKFYPL